MQPQFCVRTHRRPHCFSNAVSRRMPLPDHALIVKGKWLDLILSGEKRLEIRATNTTKRGRVGLIKSGSGLVVGEVEIVNTFTIERAQFETYRPDHLVDPDTLQSLKYRRIHAWRLANPISYDVPIPYEHPQGAIQWVCLRPRTETKRGAKRSKKARSLQDPAFSSICAEHCAKKFFFGRCARIDSLNPTILLGSKLRLRASVHFLSCSCSSFSPFNRFTL